MAMAVLQLGLRLAPRNAGVAASFHLNNSAVPESSPRSYGSGHHLSRPGSGLSVKRNAKKNIKKPGICTADELHYVAVSNSEWKLALWRYCLPSPKSSVARFMSDQGFDAWTLEL